MLSFQEWNSAKKNTGKSKAAPITATCAKDDKTTVEDPTIDYTIQSNYSVRIFVGHKIKLNEGKGPPVITLKATWKGYPTSDAPAEEPWGLMKKSHSRQVNSSNMLRNMTT